MQTREIARYVAVGLSGLTSLLYLLIALNTVSLGEVTPDEQRAFGIPAAAIFAVGAVVAYTFDKRWLWTVGAIGLALIILIYFNLSSDREPAFEVWGILIRVVQVPLLAVLTYLAFTNPKGRT